MVSNKTKNLVKVKKTTIALLALFSVFFGVWSILLDFSLVRKTVELSLLVTLLFSVIVIGEVLARSAWKVASKKAISPFEITAFTIVLLALLPSILGLFGITSQTLNVFAGALKTILIVLGISLIFTKQAGE